MERNSTELVQILNRPKNTISEKSKSISKSSFLIKLFFKMFEKNLDLEKIS